MIDGTAEFLVHHGCTAALSRCRFENGTMPQRGDRVVIRSARGLELGEVLCEATQEHTRLSPQISSATLLHLANAEDEATFTRLSQRGLALLRDAHRLIEDQHLPLLPLDIDVLLDGSQAIVYVLRWDACPLTPFLEELRHAHGLPVTLIDLSKAEPEPICGSCGGGGCGSCGDGGCSTGGCGTSDCSRDSKHTADELTAYFAQLREQMHAAISRVPLS